MNPESAPSRGANFVRSFVHAGAGVGWAARTQRNFRVQLLAAALVLAAGLALGLPGLQLGLLALTSTLVLALELLNTCVEAIVDLVSPGAHPLARVAKDTAAGAVLVGAGGSVLVGLALFVPRLIDLLHRG